MNKKILLEYKSIIDKYNEIKPEIEKIFNLINDSVFRILKDFYITDKYLIILTGYPDDDKTFTDIKYIIPLDLFNYKESDNLICQYIQNKKIHRKLAQKRLYNYKCVKMKKEKEEKDKALYIELDKIYGNKKQEV